MAFTSTNAQKLFELASRAVSIATNRLESETVEWRLECYNALIEQCIKIQESISLGDQRLVEKIGLGSVLGISRAISEWDLPDKEIYKIALEIDRFFKTGHEQSGE